MTNPKPPVKAEEKTEDAPETVETPEVVEVNEGDADNAAPAWGVRSTYPDTIEPKEAK